MQIQVALTNITGASFEKDAVELLALIEGWHGLTISEIDDRMSREWVRHMITHLPPLSKEEMASIVEEFKPRIVESFRARAGDVLH